MARGAPTVGLCGSHKGQGGTLVRSPGSALGGLSLPNSNGVEEFEDVEPLEMTKSERLHPPARR
jgi:hypothetical protein